MIRFYSETSPVNVVVKLLDGMNDRESLVFQLRVATLS